MSDRPQTKVKTSILWSFLTRWSSKFIGMINTIILARLLTPEDFGIVGIATLFIGMLETMTQVGVHLFVFRQKQEDIRLFHSAWTVTIIQGVLLGGILIISAPFIADYYGNEVLTNVIYCLALMKLIQSTQNFGVFIAQKRLNFKVDFQVTFYSRVGYLFCAVGLALWLENFWAIVYGQIILAILMVFFSYWLHPFRPKLSVYKWKELLKFSSSTIPMSTGRFLNNQADTAVMSKLASTEYFGQYHVVFGLSNLFTRGLLGPIIKGMLPNLSVLREADNFNQLFKLMVTSAVYVFLPVGVGLSAVAHEFVTVLLGQQWIAATPILVWLSLYTMIMGILMFMSEQFLIVMGREQLSNRLMWFRNVVLVAGIAFTITYQDYTELPRNLFYIGLVTLPCIVFVVAKQLEMSALTFVKDWWPALLSAAGMWLLLSHLPWPAWPVFFTLIAKVIVGAVIYSIGVGALFVLRGQPEQSPEHLILSAVKR